ncbi:ATP-binding protein [Sphingobacterium corticis]|uniref:histidine kinase n=1 Tax=Sphingobacterium corticis TaxID=1812823 RepID=A0ABW5NK26_9SPHI
MNITLTSLLDAFIHLPHAVAVYDSKDLNIAFVNTEMLQIWNRSDNLIDRNFGDVFPEHVEQGFDGLLRNVWITGETFNAQETRAEIVIDGVRTARYFDFQYLALKNESGNTYAILHTAKEVSDRMLAWKTVQEREASEAAINEELMASNEELISTTEELGATLEKLEFSYGRLEVSENQLKQIIQTAPIGLGVIHAKTKNIQSANDHFLKLLEIDQRGVGRPFPTVLSEDKVALFNRLIDQVSQTKEPIFRPEIRTTLKGFSKDYYHNVTYHPIFAYDGEVDCVLIVASDITEQRKSIVEVEDALNQLRLAKISAGLGTFDLDVENDRLVWDERCKELFGVPIQNDVSYGSDFVNGLHSEDKKRVLEQIDRSFNQNLSGGNFDVSYRTLGASDGVVRHVHAIGKVYFSEYGKPVRFVGTVRDMSNEVKMLEDLTQRDLELQQLNEELATTNEELMSINEEYQVTNEMLLTAQITSQQLNESLKRAYDQLLESEDRLNLAIQSAYIGTWKLDVEESKVYWDDRTRELYGFTDDEVVAYKDVLKYMHEADRPSVELAIDKAISPEFREDYDVTFRTIDRAGNLFRWIHAKGKSYFDEQGNPTFFSGIVLDITDAMLQKERTDAFHNLVSQKERKLQLIVDSAKVGTYTFNYLTKEIQFNDHSQNLFGFTSAKKKHEPDVIENTVATYLPLLKKGMASATAEGLLYDEVFQILDKPSGESKWLRFMGSSAGEADPNMFYGVIIDVTAQKIDEKRKTDFLGIASHELRSPLTALTGYLQILEYKWPTMQPDRIAAIVRSAEHQTTRMRALIDGFLDISHVEEGELHLNNDLIDLQDVVHDVYETFIDTVKDHVFQLRTLEHMPLVRGDRGKIEQVIVNFVNNAIKYTPSNTKITLILELAEQDVIVRVEDEGPGISEDNQTRLFDKFYRIHSANSPLISGFGIGLYISKEIVRMHGGEIGVTSVQGQGATFWFSLPIYSVD